MEVIRLRRLRTLLGDVDSLPTAKAWDSEAGMAFLRELVDVADATDMNLQEIGDRLGLPDLKYVVMAREKELEDG